MTIKVGIVIGKCPPGECGVGDYTRVLASELRKIGVDAEVVDSGDWTVRSTRENRALLRRRGYDVIHIQYPSFGFGYNLGPQLLSLISSCVVTLHEASQRRLPRKLSLLPFALRPRHVIFTSIYEQQYCAAWAPWLAKRSSIIPVGSNLPPIAVETRRALSEVVNFGLITPKKGLEQVLDLARLVRQSQADFSIQIVGRVPEVHRAYFERLRADSAQLPVTWITDLGDEDAFRKLASATFAYLPFPDGASDRRTSLKATLAAGLAVITTRGAHLPADLDRVVKLAASPQEAWAVIQALASNEQEVRAMSEKAIKFAERFSWEHIAWSHRLLYESLCGDAVGRAAAGGD